METVPWQVLARSIARILDVFAVIVGVDHRTRRINRSPYPLLAGAESLVVLLAIYLIYLAMLVSAQMLIDIGLVAGARRLIFGIARRAEERRRGAADDAAS